MDESEESKSKPRKAGEEIAKESNPVTFRQRIRGAPVIKQVLRVIDRFLLDTTARGLRLVIDRYSPQVFGGTDTMRTGEHDE